MNKALLIFNDTGKNQPLILSIKCQKIVKNVQADVVNCRLLSDYQQKTQ